ncbi:MAG: tetratricopeptide repeat protein [Clostridia bacterium]|nr:tetratricopeptide repeat protein [Clostridia bacterium]MBO4884685.1 tetratricopeptide repeat protein [Clostridia bacterium]
MGFLDAIKADNAGRRAYGLHVQANRLYDQGKTAEAKAKHDQAVKLYDEAVKGGCKKASYLMAYGVLLLRYGRFEESKELFLKAEHTPGITKQEKHQLRMNFAIAQWKLGNLDSAISQMKIAMNEGPNGLIYGSLGYILIEKARQTGDFTEAVEFNDKAMEYDDEDAVVLDNMGQLNLAMGNEEKALEYFTKAHEIKPRQVDTLYYLAKLAAKKGDKAKAVEYLDTALDGNYSALCTTTRQQALDLKAEITGGKGR